MDSIIAINSIRTGGFLVFLERLLARIENFRVKNHLRIVEQELISKNVQHLSEKLQKERSKNIARLHAYWTQGFYPKNVDFFDKRIPYFKDQFGTPCAMAYLIEKSGRQDLVSEVRQINNHVYINDIQNGPVLNWINQSGLTQAEAACVQPEYTPCGFGGCPEPDKIYLIISWIISVGSFILLEWLGYKIKISLSANKRWIRILVFSLLTIASSIISLAIFGLLYGEFNDIAAENNKIDRMFYL